MSRNNPNPAVHIISVLDAVSDMPELYNATEIERLPIGQITARLRDLDMDYSIPSDLWHVIKGRPPDARQTAYCSQDDGDGYSDWLEQEIEGLPLSVVTTELNRRGVSYSAEIELIKELVGQDEDILHSGRPDVGSFRTCSVAKAAIRAVRHGVTTASHTTSRCIHQLTNQTVVFGWTVARMTLRTLSEAITPVLYWIAGVDLEVIEQCPRRDQSIVRAQAYLAILAWLFLAIAVSYGLSIFVDGTQPFGLGCVAVAGIIASLISGFDLLMRQASWDRYGQAAMGLAEGPLSNGLLRKASTAVFLIARLSLSVVASGSIAALLLVHMLNSDVAIMAARSNLRMSRSTFDDLTDHVGELEKRLEQQTIKLYGPKGAPKTERPDREADAVRADLVRLKLALSDLQSGSWQTNAEYAVTNPDPPQLSIYVRPERRDVKTILAQISQSRPSDWLYLFVVALFIASLELVGVFARLWSLVPTTYALKVTLNAYSNSRSLLKGKGSASGNLWAYVSGGLASKPPLRTHVTDVVTRDSGLTPYRPDLARIAAAARLTASECEGRAVLRGFDGGARSSIIIGQQSIADIYQRTIDASGECIRLRRVAGMEQVRRIAADLRQIDADISVNPAHNVITEPLEAATDAIRKACAEFWLVSHPLASEKAHARASKSTFHGHHAAPPPARYSRTPMVQIGWIFAAVAFEVLTNSYFFIDASRDGLNGSLFEVILFAPINIAVAVLIGGVTLRHTRHRDKLHRRVGWIGTATLTLFSVLSNGYLAAVSLSLRLGFHTDVLSVFGDLFISRMPTVPDFHSLAVFISGLFWAGFAGWEAFRLFDPYPGYTSYFRRWEEARAAVLAAQETHGQNLADIERKYTELLDANLATYTQKVTYIDNCREAMAADVVRHRRLAARLRDDYRDLVNELRAAYIARPTHAGQDLPEIPPVDFREAFDLTDDLDPNVAECNRIHARLVRLSQDLTRQLSFHVVANQEFTPEFLRELRRGFVHSPAYMGRPLLKLVRKRKIGLWHAANANASVANTELTNRIYKVTRSSAVDALVEYGPTVRTWDLGDDHERRAAVHTDHPGVLADFLIARETQKAPDKPGADERIGSAATVWSRWPTFVRMMAALELSLICGGIAVPALARYLPLGGSHLAQLGLCLGVAFTASEVWAAVGRLTGKEGTKINYQPHHGR